jgi:hypothetical protein
MKKIFILFCFFTIALTKGFASTASLVVKTELSTNISNLDAHTDFNTTPSISVSTPEKKNFWTNLKHKVYTSKLFKKYMPEEESNFYFGSFLLGLLLGLIGMLIVYLVNADSPNRKKKMRSATAGWLVWLVILLFAYSKQP